MFPGQTEFVPECGILLNVVRATNIISEHTIKGKTHIYGVFIDFACAYNSVRHGKLFQKLEGILEKDEVQFLKAIYSKNTICMGSQKFKPNCGVAQGSIISPYLFDIYIEDMLTRFEGLVPVENGKRYH